MYVKRVFLLLVVSLVGSALLVSFGIAVSRTLSFSDTRSFLASVFFTDSVTVAGLTSKYEHAGGLGTKKVRILIVPGHDNESWGTEFRGVREADMTAAVGEELFTLLSADPEFEPILLRSRQGYAPEFLEYFSKERGAVEAFVTGKKAIMNEMLRHGFLRRSENVIHNSAAADVAAKLYAVNRFANDRGVDIVLHLHFNDYPGRPYHRQGRYEGFAIYTPAAEYSNATASNAFAHSLFAQFSKFYAESSFPQENGGIVPDQDLIAVGAYNTLDPVGALIEYGYIYETKFLDKKIREAFLRELAFQTYVGVNRFFGNEKEAIRRYQTTFLPHTWRDPLSVGMYHNPAVLSLQAALFLEDLYPPRGATKRSCPLSGSFGPCTARSVAHFQEKYAIAPATGVAGERTIRKLNAMYGK